MNLSSRNLENFWGGIEKIPFHSCWEWVRGRGSHGYGHIKVKGAMRMVHRISYTLHKGPIPPGLFVLHSCDNPLCVNPDHLSLGTNSDNMKDMVDRGRSTRGERNPKAKLTVADVLLIKVVVSLKAFPSKVIAKYYGLTTPAIHKIVCGENWGWVGEKKND